MALWKSFKSIAYLKRFEYVINISCDKIYLQLIHLKNNFLLSLIPKAVICVMLTQFFFLLKARYIALIKWVSCIIQ